MLNIDKPEGIWLEKCKAEENQYKSETIKWPNNPVRYLGLYIGETKMYVVILIGDQN